MFHSTYDVNVDSKGRVSVPAPFRSALNGGSRVFLWPALDGSGCLEGGGEELMAMYRQTILRLPPQSRKRKILSHAIIARAHDLKMDDPGRIKLPEKWVAKTGVTDKVVFAGNIESFQVWEPSAYEAFDLEVDGAMSEAEFANALDEPYSEALASGGLPGLSAIEGGGD